MQVSVQAVSSQTTSTPIIVPRSPYFGVGFGVVLTNTPNLTYKVQHTFDQIGDGTNGTVLAANATWFDHSTVTGKTTNQDGNYAFPVYAIRLNVTAYTAGTATLTVLSSAY
jgi:hypothetical protein